MPFRRLPLLILLSFPVALAAQSSAEWSTFRTAAASAGPRSSSAGRSASNGDCCGVDP